MALLELTLGSVYFNQQCVNRWTYQSSGVPSAVSLSFALWAAFGALRDVVAFPASGGYSTTTIFGQLRGLLSQGVTFQVLTCRALYSATDFYEGPFAEDTNGQSPGEGSSPTLAFGYKSARTRLDIARGTKRFAGVSEAAVGAGGTNLNFAPNTNGTFLATAMSIPLTYDDEGTVLSFSPVILGTQRYNPVTGLPDVAGKAYRRYPTEAEQLTHVASTGTWSQYPTIRTQVSRQYGRGT